MSSGTSSEADRPRRARIEAAAWIAKLHGPDRSRETDRGLRRWLAEDPAHAAEFELATDVWNETARVPMHDPGRYADRSRSAVRHRLVWGLAAAVTVCLLAGVWIAYGIHRSMVSTGVGEQKTLTLADGTRVTLNTDSRILVRYRQRVRRVILRYGEAYFQVVHNPARPFVVQAGDRKVIDVGTSFIVRRNGEGKGSLSVTVIEGRVAVAPLAVADIIPKVPPPKVLLVSAGTRLLLRPHSLPSIRVQPAGQATAWLRGQLVFNETRLGVAAAQFNRYDPVKIVLGASQLGSIRVSGLFRTGASESFARAVAQAHHLKLITRHGEIILAPDRGHSDVGSARHP